MNGNSIDTLGNVELSLKQYKRILQTFEIVLGKLEDKYNDKKYISQLQQC
jgi:hypothetical protein